MVTLESLVEANPTPGHRVRYDPGARQAGHEGFWHGARSSPSRPWLSRRSSRGPTDTRIRRACRGATAVRLRPAIHRSTAQQKCLTWRLVWVRSRPWRARADGMGVFSRNDLATVCRRAREGSR
jgi:hypothetical protein